jgi:hypothetical protein
MHAIFFYNTPEIKNIWIREYKERAKFYYDHYLWSQNTRANLVI